MITLPSTVFTSLDSNERDLDHEAQKHCSSFFLCFYEVPLQKIRLTTLMLLCCLISLLPLYGQTTLADQEALVSKADAVLARSIEGKEFVGLSAGIFIDDEIRWSNGAGLLNLETKEPATKDMLHRIASISKPMTAVAVLQLARAGKLNLDATIDAYLPDCKIKRKDEITVRQLLNHTSGIAAYASRKETLNQVHYPNSAAAMDIFQSRKLKFKPGKGYQYTTYGYTVLGAIIEKVTGDSYAAYMRTNVWQPAGMVSTDIEDATKAYANKSSLYGTNETGAFIADRQDDLSNKYAGGGIHSTVDDLLRFGQAILDNKLITAEELNSMQEFPDVKRNDTPYGLGWFLSSHPDFGRIIRHGGAQSGTSTYLTIYLDARVITVVVGNTSEASMEVGGLRHQLGKAALRPESLNESLRPIATLTTEQLDRFTGTFTYPDGGKSSVVRRGNQLFAEAKNAPTFKLYPASETAVFAISFPLEFNYKATGDGELQVVSRVMNGETVTAE